MSYMFQDAKMFNQNIGGWNVGSVNDMSYMFFGSGSISVFNQNIGPWNVGLVTNMQFMFYGASAFNQDISGWNVGLVTNMQYMFNYALVFNQNMCTWKDKIPFISNTQIFNGSGCNNKNTPTTASGPFCAVDTCT